MKDRDFGIDFVRLIAILGVVTIHTSTFFTGKSETFSFDFYLLHAINQLSRFAVPAFFAISGFLLATHYSSMRSPALFYKKRLHKILIPYLSWSIIYFLFVYPHSFNEIFRPPFLYGIIDGTLSYQLYFIPAIFILYIIFPLILKLKNLLLTGWFSIFVIFIETIVLPLVYFEHINVPLIVPVKHAFFNFLPFFAGIYCALKIKDMKNLTKNHLLKLALISITCAIVIFCESVFMFATTNNSNFLRDQWRISVMVYGIFASALFYYFYNPKWNKIISYLSSFSFGVFFVHVAFLEQVQRFTSEFKFFGILPFVAGLFFVLAASFTFSAVLSRVSIINRILGLRS